MSTKNEFQIVCDNIRLLRQHYGLSRTAMARRLRITVKTLDSLEAGIFPDRIRVDFFYCVQAAFGIPPRQLLTPLPDLPTPE